ncbi:MAG: NTP transferase domain-containing protein [Fidelibacterota bacterium]
MSDRPPLGVVILAAGRGKRMGSSLPKVLHPVAGEPMIVHAVRTARAMNPEKIVIVVCNGRDQVMDALNGGDIVFVEQARRLGTGHAVLQAREEFAGFQGNIVVLSGDVPLLSQMTLDKLLHKHYVSHAAATFLSVIFDNPVGYGRMVRNGDGSLDRIVEEKDCTGEFHSIKEVNAGVYVFDAPQLFRYLPEIGKDNAQGEYYLPDVQALMKSAGLPVAIYQVPDSREVGGVNSPEQLAEVNRIYGELYENN